MIYCISHDFFTHFSEMYIYNAKFNYNVNDCIMHSEERTSIKSSVRKILNQKSTRKYLKKVIFKDMDCYYYY